MMDRRRLRSEQVVRIRQDAPQFAGLWMVIKEIGEDYVTGLILVQGESPIVTRQPRTSVESAMRVFLRGAKQHPH